MYRVKISLPEQLPFHCHLAVRITDMNYGQHAGNERMLQYLQEARVQWLASLEMSELQVFGTALIMADAAVRYRSEIRYPALLQVQIGIVEWSRSAFTLGYRVLVEMGNQQETRLAAEATTTLVCYDYAAQKTTVIPEAAKLAFQPFVAVQPTNHPG